MTPIQKMTSGAGRVLGGRYTLLTPIAQGGMGEVWKARDRVSGHIVAAKVLRPELSGEELSLSRLRLEARNSMSRTPARRTASGGSSWSWWRGSPSPTTCAAGPA